MTKPMASDLRNLLAHAVELKKQERYLEANVFFSNAAGAYPMDALVNCLYAENLKNLGQVDEAEKITDYFLSAAPTAEFCMLKADIARMRGRIDESSRIVMSAAQNGFVNYDIALHASRYFLQEQNFDAAEEIIKKLPKNSSISRKLYDALNATVALIKFLRGDVVSCRRNVAMLCKSFLDKNKKSFKKSHIDILEIYVKYMADILAINRDIKGPDEHLEKVYILGDSHCLSPAYLPVQFNGKTRQIIPKLVLGCKAWHLYKQTPQAIVEGFKNALSSIPAGATVFISLGEIDCRVNEGFFAQYLKNCEYDIQHNITNTINSFVDWIDGQAKNLDIRFISAPAPREEQLAGLTPEQQKVFLAIAPAFNAALLKKLGTERYVDLYNAVVDENGRGDAKLYIDNVHMLPNIYQQIIGNLS